MDTILGNRNSHAIYKPGPLAKSSQCVTSGGGCTGHWWVSIECRLHCDVRCRWLEEVRGAFRGAVHTTWGNDISDVWLEMKFRGMAIVFRMLFGVLTNSRQAQVSHCSELLAQLAGVHSSTWMTMVRWPHSTSIQRSRG